MCRRITCAKCGKESYAGCGMHIEQVLGDVPASQRCVCGQKKPPRVSAASQPERKKRWWQP